MADEGLLGQAWGLAPGVAVRPEPFGALVYSFVTRQLTFLKTAALADAVNRLDESADVAGALAAAGVPQEQWDAYADAIGVLGRTGLLVRRGQDVAA